MRAAIAALLVLTTLSACKLGPDYQRPPIELPANFIDSGDSGASLANMDWWEVFNDKQLVALINTALIQSKELAIATARLEEARARLGFTRADLYPQLDVGAGASRGNSAEIFIPGSGVRDNYILAANVFYEVDLFGKLRRATEAARAEMLATEDARQTVLTAVIADVASTYFLLRDFDARYEIARETLAARQGSTDIVRKRFSKGVVPLLDVNQAEIEEADAAAIMAAAERDRIRTQNLLNVLLGRNSEPIVRGRTLEDQTTPPQVPAGLPSELLERRPDIRNAEQLLAAQTARVGVAEALRWPSLGLTGTYGAASNDLSDLISSDAIWDISANLLAPVFNAGRNKRRVEIEKARTKAAMVQYELSVLIAMREVDDALTSIRTLKAEHEARLAQVRAARSASMLSRARYNGGVTSYLEVLDSERSLFRAEIEASKTRRAQLVAVVELYKALGGGRHPQTQ